MKNEIIPLVSFPKSGNTWMRFVLSNIFKKDDDFDVNFNTINLISPTACSQDLESFAKLLKCDAPLFIKEHDDYKRISFKDFKKAIYIYRNGFDTILSYWYFRSAQSPGKFPDLETFLKYYWSEFGHWGDNLYSWLEDKNTLSKHDIYPIKYEELLEDPVDIIYSCLNDIGFGVDKEKVEKAVQESSKDKMKKMKGSDAFMKSKDKNFHFVRKGVKNEGDRVLSDKFKAIFLKYKMNYNMMLKHQYLDRGNKWEPMVKRDTPSPGAKLIAHYYTNRYKVISAIKMKFSS